MKEAIMKIDGMKCGMCETHVNDVVRKVGGVKKVKSSHQKGETIVVLEDESKIKEIIQAIASQGYKVLNFKVTEYEKKGLFSFLRK